MRKLVLRLCPAVLFCLLCINITSTCFAEEIFNDDFSSGNVDTINNWEVVNGDWTVKDGMLNNYLSDRDMHSEILVKSLALEDFCLSTVVKQQSGVDQHFLLRADLNKGNYYVLGLRYDGYIDSNEIVLYKSVSGVLTLLAKKDYKNTGYSLSHGVLRDLKICVNEDLVTSSLDGDGVISVRDTDPILSGGVGFQSWSGAFRNGIDNYWDNVKVDNLKDNGVVDKVVIVPGLGGSWNSRAIMGGENVPDAQWKPLPFLDVYSNLEKSFENVGYTKDNGKLVLYNYDWRTPLAQTVDRFDAFLTDKGVREEDNVVVVGHSLGGIIGRLHKQLIDNGKVDKVIALGSPQMGALGAYRAWAGGQVAEHGSLSGMDLLLKLKSLGYPTQAEALRTLAPVILDIVPVYTFAQDKTGVPLQPVNLVVKNTYLSDKLVGGAEYFTAIGAKEIETPYKIVLGPTNWVDKLRGLWPDGQIDSIIATQDGDGTVVGESVSAMAEGEPTWFNGVKHRNLPANQQVIASVFSTLGLDTAKIVAKATDEEKLFFYLGSPATLQVFSPAGEIVSQDTDGFVVFDSVVGGVYSVKVVGTGSGMYHLVAGVSNQPDKWQIWQLPTEEGLIDTWDIEIGNDGVLVKGDGGLEMMLKHIKLSLVQLELEKLVEYVDHCQEYLQMGDKVKARQELTKIKKGLFVKRQKLSDDRFLAISEQVLFDLVDALGYFDRVIKMEGKPAAKLLTLLEKDLELLEERQKKLVDKGGTITKRVGYAVAAAQSIMTDKGLEFDWLLLAQDFIQEAKNQLPD